MQKIQECQLCESESLQCKCRHCPAVLAIYADDNEMTYMVPVRGPVVSPTYGYDDTTIATDQWQVCVPMWL